jgi:hypothetical protein
MKAIRFLTGSLTLLLLTAAPLAKGASEIFIPPAAGLLQTLRHEHPRLLVHPDDFARIQRLVGEDGQASSWYAGLIEEGDEILSAPVSTYVIPDGLRLLRTSRTVLHRVYTLGLLFQLRGDNRYLERVWQEVEAAAGFPDWNPRHFLDTAEMSHALAIAYDWLYDSWSDQQKRILRDAILTHGLRPAWEAYREEAAFGWWTRVGHNWNQVCNGGIGIAALAIAEEEPEFASKLLYEALIRLPEAMVHYGPDGGWNEGPGYWHYATAYNVYILAALETALGTDFDLSKIEGFSEAGTFPIFMTGPTGKTFNFADGGERTIRAPELFWLARKFQRPEYASYQVRHALGSVLDLLWFDPDLARREVTDRPLDAYYRGLEVVTMRSAWSNPEAFFVGFKAGDNKANHSNLDVGTFVLDALGERWAVDLGADNYNLPKYFETGRRGTRWTYYRMRAEGHNTIVIDPTRGADQDPFAKAVIDRFNSKPERVYALSNIAPAYGTEPHAVRRQVALVRGVGEGSPRVIIEDYIEMDEPAYIWWFLHTPAEVRLERDGRQAILRLGEKELSCELISSPEASFQVMDAQPLPSSPDPAGQSTNDGIRKLAIRFGGVREAEIKVVIKAY